MKRLLTGLLAALLLPGLWGCGPVLLRNEPTEVPLETAAPETEEATLTPETEPPTEETEPEILEGNLFLTVSAITFSTVGEQEDIYLGLIPRELVVWESEDPDIVTVEKGVLTATGVGTTTIRATYFDRTVSCTAGCLAATEEELNALDWATLTAPKRLPPEVDTAESRSFYDKSAIVGDSITFFLEKWEKETDGLGDMTFLCRGGVSMNSLVRRFKNIWYNGSERVLEKAVAESGVARVYFLMGSNDISSRNQRPYVFENWTILLERIRQASPGVEIVLMSNIPLYGSPREAGREDFQEKNDRIYDYNEKLKQFAEENGCLFLDLCAYAQDHKGRLPEGYSQGSYHMNKAGCLMWMQVLRLYAQYELEGGTLS